MDHWTLRTVGADRVVAQIESELDLANGDDLVDYISTLLGEWHGRVEVDLSNVTFIDSSGLNALLRAHRVCSERRATLVIVNPSEVVARLFELTGCTHIITIIAGDPVEPGTTSDSRPSRGRTPRRSWSAVFVHP